jgi:myosin heavy subunit
MALPYGKLLAEAENALEMDPMLFLAQSDATRMKEQATPFDAKTVCWIATPITDPEGYVAADIEGTTGDMVNIKVKGEMKEVKKEACDQMNPPKYEKCTDMSNLTFLNEASVLYNLRARFAAGMIYTYSGLFCVVINPYKRLPIYLDKVVQMYRGKRRPEMPPHIYAIVDNAYQDMLIDHDNQSMLITGESGAGKTENTKKVIQYIAKVAGVEKDKNEAPPPANALTGSLDEQIVSANPLLEAFGNAKTTRNNNSSRFGKFIRCHFSQTGKLAGADIEGYLLEKNRVTQQGSQERNYHIFYQILYSSTDEELASYCLMTRDAHQYLYLSYGVTHVDRMDDNEEFGLTVDAIRVLGFNPEEHVQMFKITAAILNFSNCKFKQKPRDEQAEVADTADGERVAHLLGLQVKDFLNSLIKPRVKVGTEYVNKGQNVTQVLYAVTALCKAVYERMFFWIMERVNVAFETKKRRSYFIGVLDIAGFEIFEYNSFDQLCINYTNERLQQFFNHHMFVLEQEEYKKEGIKWESIDFGMDLAKTIDLIEKPGGILAMLEEECIVPKATDTTYLNKMNKAHAGKSDSYVKPTPKQVKQGCGDFILHHYAGSVGYSVAGWLEKNKDPINEHTAQLFSKATTPLVAYLFQDYDPDKAGKRKGSAFQTVSFRHKESLKNLMDTLMATSPHFVRCIIPNENKAPGEMDGQLVLHQLRCNGVLEGIRICRKGFPSRMLFADFKQRYQILAASAIPAGFIDGKVACEKLMEALQMDENEFRIGITKVFFRAGIIGELEEMRDERLSKIIAQFQAYCKGHLARIEFKKMKDRVVGLAVLQRNIRKFFAIRNWPWWKLYLLVQPMLSVARAEDEMAEKEAALKEAMENAEANAKKLGDLEESAASLQVEKERLFADLKAESERLSEVEDQLAQETNERQKLEFSLNEAIEKLEGEAHSAKTFLERNNKQKKEMEELGTKIDEGRELASKLEAEKATRDRQIDALNEDIAKQDEALSKVNKEKKGVEEQLAERNDQLQATEDKLSALNKAKNKVEGTLKETEFNLTKEKDGKAKVEKEKRKVEGDLKETRDKLSTTEEDLGAAKDTVVKRDKSIRDLEEAKEGLEGTVKGLQKKIADLLARIEELEEELEAERKAKQKSELSRKELETQLEELNEALLVSGDATAAQSDISKKKDAEIGRLRKEVEEAAAAGEEALSGAKSKAAAALAEAADEIETVKKAKAKSDKEKAAVAAELGDSQAEVEKLKKQNATAVRNARSLDDAINELKGKLEEAEAALVESDAKGAKAAGDAASNAKALEEAESKLAAAGKAKKTLDAALEESKGEAEAESKAKHDLNLKLKAAIADNEALAETIEEEGAAKAALQAKLSKVTAEAAAGKGGLSIEDSARVEELEGIKSKLGARVQELEEALAAGDAKAASAEKVKNRLNEEVEDLTMELEKVQSSAASSEKKQKKVEATIREWVGKTEELKAAVEAAEKNARNSGAEVVKARAAAADLEEALDTAKKDARALAAENKAIAEQLSGGGKSSVEVEKLQRKLGAENEELAAALEEAEGALAQEEAKFLKLQLEHAALKGATEKKAAEKDEELESARKNHQKQLGAIQATVDAGAKTTGDLQRDKKLLEGAIIELENAVEAGGRNVSDYQKTIRKLQGTIKELTAAVAEETDGRDAAREAALKADARANELAIACDEARVALEQSERARKLAEGLTNENSDRLNELQALYAAAASAKRKVDDDYHALQDEIEELENSAAAAEANAGKAAAETARVAIDLSAAQAATANAEKSRALVAKQLAETQLALEEAEGGGGRGIKAQIRQLELKIMELESDLDAEARKSANVLKTARKADKRVKEVEAALDEERKGAASNVGAVELLKTKIQTLRFQLDESDANLNALQTKYKRAVLEAEEAEKRCESAELALQKARARAKTNAPSLAVSRQRSHARTPVATD